MLRLFKRISRSRLCISTSSSKPVSFVDRCAFELIFHIFRERISRKVLGSLLDWFRGQHVRSNSVIICSFACSDVNVIERFLGRSGTARLRNPLDFARAVSPIILLSQSLLHRAKHMDRAFLIQAWQSQSSPRPRTLSAVELEIWTFIRDLALGRVTDNTAWIMRIESHLSNEHEQAGECDWFAPSGPCP